MASSLALVPVPTHLQATVQELTETLTDAGLMPLAALDLAETIVLNPATAKSLRWLTGDALLAQRAQEAPIE